MVMISGDGSRQEENERLEEAMGKGWRKRWQWWRGCDGDGDV